MEKIEFVTPVGRLVDGDVFKGRTSDGEGNPYVYKSGPRAGQPRTQYYFGLAIEKSAPDYQEFYQKIDKAARDGFPEFFTTGVCSKLDFSWKIIDGDGVDSKGRPYPEREGFAGHWVVKFSGSTPPTVVDSNAPRVNHLTMEGSVKPGDYIRVVGNTNGNKDAAGNAKSPGIYMNYSIVQLVRPGVEITRGPDPDAILQGNTPRYIPSGALNTPAASTPPPVNNTVPVSSVTPNSSILKPPVKTMIPPAPAKPQITQTLINDGHTYESLIAAGWTDETLKEHGHLV